MLIKFAVLFTQGFITPPKAHVNIIVALKILLINLARPEKEINEPIGICAVASYTRICIIK